MTLSCFLVVEIFKNLTSCDALGRDAVGPNISLPRWLSAEPASPNPCAARLEVPRWPRKERSPRTVEDHHLLVRDYDDAKRRYIFVLSTGMTTWGLGDMWKTLDEVPSRDFWWFLGFLRWAVKAGTHRWWPCLEDPSGQATGWCLAC